MPRHREAPAQAPEDREHPEPGGGEIELGGVDRHRAELGIGERVARIGHAPGQLRRPPVAAPVEETSDAPEQVAERHRGRGGVRHAPGREAHALRGPEPRHRAPDHPAVKGQAPLPERQHASPLVAELVDVLQHVHRPSSEDGEHQGREDDGDHAVLVESEPARLLQGDPGSHQERHRQHQPVGADVDQAPGEDVGMHGSVQSLRRRATFWRSPISIPFTISAVPP